MGRTFSSTVLAACWVMRLIAQAPVTEHIDVHVSNIDVIVTDGAGHFVHGLTRDDFAVYDGGKTQHLTNFAEYSSEPTGPGRAPDHASAPAAPTIENPRPLSTILILVDHLHLRPATRARAVAAVARFVTAHAGTNIGYVLASYDGTLHLYPLAGDASDAARAVSAVSRTAVSSLQMVRERQQLLEVMQTESDPIRVYRSVLDYAELERHNMEEMLVALDDAITAIAGADGPKRLLYISDGLPQAAAPEMFRYYDQRFHTNSSIDALTFDASRSWQRITAHANAVGVTMYMLQASGAASEELAPLDTPTLETKLDLSTIRDNTRGVLQYLADETGGRAILDTNELDVPLAGLADELFNYYSLGYRTPSPADGPHSVSVRINRPGLHLRYRRSYNIRSPNKALADAVQTLFYFPRSDNPLNAALSIGRPKPAGRRRWVVPIVLTVPHANLLAGGTVTCFLAVMNAAGDHTIVKSLTVPVGERGDLVQSINLTVGPGEQVLAAAVRDDVTTITTFLRQNFAAGH